MFTALVLDKADGQVTSEVKNLNEAGLPDGDVTVRVAFSTLNWKDGAIIKGTVPLVRHYPHVPGVDFAGTVEASDNPDFQPGDPVVLTGWGVGERQWGGHGQKARVKGDWLVPLPDGLTAKRAMALGTAGFTAMLAVMTLEQQGLRPDQGQVLVTGAAGGVGSVAVALLAQGGYEVAASTGRASTHDYLRGLGAHTIIDRQELLEPVTRPLDSARWAGCIDSVGGVTLARLLTQMNSGAAVAAVGLAGGAELNTTVMPFILRGARLIGVESVYCPVERRREAWARLATELPMDTLDAITVEAPLGDLPRLAGEILEGQVRGRLVIDVNA